MEGLADLCQKIMQLLKPFSVLDEDIFFDEGIDHLLLINL